MSTQTHPHVRVVRNIAYRTQDDPHFDASAHSLDVYVPHREVSGDGPYPVIMHVHGGAWCVGSRQAAKNTEIGVELARRGMLCIMPSYRLSFPALDRGGYLLTAEVIGAYGLFTSRQWVERGMWLLTCVVVGVMLLLSSAYVQSHQFPCHLDDVADALQYSISHVIPEFNGNVNQINVMGHSAGAHLASMLVSHPHYHRRFDIKRIIVLSGVFDPERLTVSRESKHFLRYVFGDKISEAFPVQYIRQQQHNRSVQWLVLFGDYEFSLDAHSIDLIQLLRSQNQGLRFERYRGLDHFSILSNWTCDHAFIPDAIERFCLYNK